MVIRSQMRSFPMINEIAFVSTTMTGCIIVDPARCRLIGIKPSSFRGVSEADFSFILVVLICSAGIVPNNELKYEAAIIVVAAPVSIIATAFCMFFAFCLSAMPSFIKGGPIGFSCLDAAIRLIASVLIFCSSDGSILISFLSLWTNDFGMTAFITVGAWT